MTKENTMHQTSQIATEELARLLTTLSHRHRIGIIEELRSGEKDVSTLSDILKISRSRVSQHMSLLRSHHLVRERREGRHVYYHLVCSDVAIWLAQGLRFVETEIDDTSNISDAVREVESLWLQSNSDT